MVGQTLVLLAYSVTLVLGYIKKIQGCMTLLKAFDSLHMKGHFIEKDVKVTKELMSKLQQINT